MTHPPTPHPPKKNKKQKTKKKKKKKTPIKPSQGLYAPKIPWNKVASFPVPHIKMVSYVPRCSPVLHFHHIPSKVGFSPCSPEINVFALLSPQIPRKGLVNWYSTLVYRLKRIIWHGVLDKQWLVTPLPILTAVPISVADTQRHCACVNYSVSKWAWKNCVGSLSRIDAISISSLYL